MTKLTVYGDKVNGISGFEVQLSDGTKSGLLGKEGWHNSLFNVTLPIKRVK